MRTRTCWRSSWWSRSLSWWEGPPSRPPSRPRSRLSSCWLCSWKRGHFRKYPVSTNSILFSPVGHDGSGHINTVPVPVDTDWVYINHSTHVLNLWREYSLCDWTLSSKERIKYFELPFWWVSKILLLFLDWKLLSVADKVPLPGWRCLRGHSYLEWSRQETSWDRFLILSLGVVRSRLT